MAILPPRKIWKILMIVAAAILIPFTGLIAFGLYQDQQQCKEDLSATRDLIGQAIANHTLNQMQQSGAHTALATMQSACDHFDAKRAQTIGIAIAVHLSFANDVSVASPAQHESDRDAHINGS